MATLAAIVCGCIAVQPPHVFRVFHNHTVTASVTALWQRSARLSGIPFERRDGSKAAHEALTLCNVTHEYKVLVPPAYRGDLMRYCLLWLHGGMYIDLMTTITHPMAWLVDTHPMQLTVVRDRPARAYWNAFIAGPPKHPAFFDALALIRDNVRECALTHSDLGVTGPDLWYRAAHKYNPQILGTLQECKEFTGCVFVKNVLVNKMPGYRKEFAEMGYVRAQKYSRLWKRGRVYASLRCKLSKFSSLFWL